MLLKSKICFTVLAIYEMAAVSVLHFQRICDSIFPTPFCDSWYRYFLFCVIVPALVLLILMWIRELVRAHRRRRFFRRAKATIHDVISSIRGRVTEHIDARDMEKIITAAVLVGIKKYADKHPNLRHNVNNIMDVADGTVALEEVDTTPPRTSRATRQTRRPATRRRGK